MSEDSSPPVPAPADRELAAHLDNTPLAVIAWDREGRVRRWGGQAERVFGWTAAEAVGRHSFDLIPPHPEDRAKVAELVTELLTGRRPRGVMRNRNVAKGGRVVWCEWYSSIFFDERGVPASSLSLVLDITERVEAAEALGMVEGRLRQFLDGARMVGWEWDFVARRITATSALGPIIGLAAGPDATTRDGLWAPVHPDHRAAVRAAVQEPYADGGEFLYHFRGTAPGPDGRERWFSTRGQTLLGPDGRPERLVGVTTDITERKRAEQEQDVLARQLLDAQKWESLGVLAGGIAHDFNNLLTVVLGSASLAQRYLPPNSPVAPYLAQIEEAAERGAGLCKEMLAYAGRGPAPAGSADLSRIIRDSRGLLEVSGARRGRLRLELADRLPPVRADEEQARRVLVNLVMNAGEAVGEGGEVVVRTSLAEVTGEEPADSFRLTPAPGVYVRLDVADTGPGITPEASARLFDPFFTTKFPGRGLGLPAVLGIVKTHRGGIRVDTAPGRGTTFEVYWPPAGTTPAAPARLASPAVQATPRGGVALVVDDEMYVREVAASTLEDAGYTAVLAGDGPSGLEEFRAHRGEVRVVVLDLVMPGMGGDELLAAIRAEAPDVPAVLVSGYADRHPGDRDARTAFLQKPFRPEELAAAVERVVAATSAAPRS
jgi:PAS domain S-box-containing protein